MNYLYSGKKSPKKIRLLENIRIRIRSSSGKNPTPATAPKPFLLTTDARHVFLM